MLCKKSASLNSTVTLYFIIPIDRGYAFSQEAGQAPQITNNLLTKLKQGFQAKLSFTPNVAQTNNQYKPNTESINPQIDGEGALQGSFNPDYIRTDGKNNQHQQLIQDNYFENQLNPDTYEAEPILIEEDQQETKKQKY